MEAEITALREAANSVLEAAERIIISTCETYRVAQEPGEPEEEPKAASHHLMDVHEIAEYLGVSEAWVNKRTSQLPVKRLGKGRKSPIRIKLEDLDKWLDSNTTP